MGATTLGFAGCFCFLMTASRQHHVEQCASSRAQGSFKTAPSPPRALNRAVLGSIRCADVLCAACHSGGAAFEGHAPHGLQPLGPPQSLRADG